MRLPDFRLLYSKARPTVYVPLVSESSLFNPTSSINALAFDKDFFVNEGLGRTTPAGPNPLKFHMAIFPIIISANCESCKNRERQAVKQEYTRFLNVVNLEKGFNV